MLTIFLVDKITKEKEVRADDALPLLHLTTAITAPPFDAV